MVTRSLRRKPANLPVKPVPRNTLPDQIYRQIKDLILDGGIAPGELVTIQGLADAFGVSAMPVREALQRLTTERALTIVTGRSMGIPELSADHLTDLCRVRLEIEGLAAEWAAERIEPAALRNLGGLIEALDKAVAASDARLFVRANRELHFTVYRASGSDTLSTIIEGLWLQISPYVHLLRGSGNYATANKHHKALLEALKRRDGAGARKCIRADIEAAAQMLLPLLK